ncbi:hypothetical protein ACMZ62_06850 [Streptococcus pluranimalium]
MIIDRSYIPYQSLRNYKDRGMAKWMGFFLSEHTDELQESKARIDLSTSISENYKLTLLGQSYAQQRPVSMAIKSDKVKFDYYGVVTDFSEKCIILRTEEGFHKVMLENILTIQECEDFDDDA